VPPPLLLVLIVWGLLTGMLEIVTAVQLPRRLAVRWLVGTGGLSSVFLALVVLALPRAASDRIVLSLAVYAAVFGIVMLTAALHFRAAGRGATGGATLRSPVLGRTAR
jgi:acid phosphatase family membrane protein YuiD